MAGDARFFGSSGKRGDLQELREELHSTKLDKKRDAVRKVIANMTLGKDVSSLFADVLNCMQTQSLDLKKLVYLYVVNYSATQPELAILAVNTFRKDSVDPNPLIRALAVRTMGCIRLDAVTEYILEPLRRSCQDSDPYVRKTAVMCIAKLYDIQPELVEEHGFSEILKDLLTDSNPAVVANCVATLSEMSKRNPAFLQLTDQSIQNLLNALNECSEWAQALILDSISHSYHPPTPRAAEAILERVSPRLSHANQAVALSTVRLFLRFSDLLGQQESSRLMRKVGPPLVTLLHAESEIQFVVLRSLNLILRKKGLAAVLNMDVKIFFCKYNDPVFVKLEKLELLALLVGEGNLEVVLSEMRDYANEIDVEFVRKTIRTIGRIAIKFPQAAEPCINLLLELMKTSNGEYVTQESFVVVANIFRRYPGEYEAVIQTLCENLESIDEPEGKAAIIWVLGEYSERIDNAAEILEHFLTHFHDEPAQVRCVLLTGVVKLFLKSPGTATQQMVTRTLKLCTEETDDPDLRDRGYMYWRLLSSDPKVTKEVVLGTKPKISDDSGRLPPKMLETLIHGVGTLSSVYRQLPDTFLAKRSGSVERATVDEDSEDEDAPERLRQLQEEMKNGPATKRPYVEEETSEDSDEEGSSSSSSEEEKVSEEGSDRAAASPSKRAEQEPEPAYALVLPETRPGKQGTVGLKAAAALVRHTRDGGGGQLLLYLAVQNRASQPQRQFALQLNKNVFGITLSKEQSAMVGTSIGTLGAGESRTVVLPLSVVPLAAGSPPGAAGEQAQLYLEAAMKSSADLWYFKIPLDFATLLVPGMALAQTQWDSSWSKLGASKEVTSVILEVQPGTASPTFLPSMLRRLRETNMIFVSHHLRGGAASGGSSSPSSPPTAAHSFQLGGCTVNRIALFVELHVRGVGAQLKIRTEHQVFVPLVQKLIEKALTSGDG